MAISKNGGTRSRLRGRVGSEVYTMGKDGRGNKQQIVKAIAEKVENPQTASQMRTRMIMSTCQQAKSAMRYIVDHSFDKVVTPLANLSRFVSLNAQLIRADINAHPSEDNLFGLSKYGEKGLKQGAWLISEGYANAPHFDDENISQGLYILIMDDDDFTKSDIMAALGMYAADYLTFCAIDSGGSFLFCRYRFNPAFDNNTIVTSGNVSQLFLTEGNVKFAVSISGEGLVFNMSPAIECHGVIKSVKTRSGYIHSTCQMYCVAGIGTPSDEAFPTYPVGKSAYLNGGDIQGMSEEGGSEPEPEPEPVPPVLTDIWAGSGHVLNESSYDDFSSVPFNTRITYQDENFDAGFYFICCTNRNIQVGEEIPSGAQVISIECSPSNTQLSITSTSFGRFYLAQMVDEKLVVLTRYGYIEYFDKN